MTSTATTHRYRGFSILLMGGLFYSLYGVFSRIIGDSLPQFFQIWTRAAIIIGLLLVSMWLTKKQLVRVRKGDLKWFLIAAASGGLLNPPFYIAINHLALGTTLFAFYATGTMVSYVLGKVLFGEKLSQAKIISLVIAMIGLLLLYIDTLQLGNLYYLSMAGFAGALFGVNINAIKKINTAYPSLQVNLFNWSGALLISLAVSIVIAEPWSVPIATLPWLANVGLAVCSLAASLSVIFGFKYIEMQKGSLILLSELVFGVLLGVVLYQEVPTITAAVGSLLVFIALIVPSINLNQNKNCS